jgi:UDP-N-acetylglucosamine 1-carboxyvinyltransferase
MDKFLIDGPCRVRGKILVSGSKNASLPILAATLLFDQPVIIKNLPRVRDINTMLNLLRSLGSRITQSKDKKTVKIINKKKNENFCKLFSCKNNERFYFSFRTFNRKIP